MKRLLSLLALLLLVGALPSRLLAATPPAGPDDTILVKLPNQATMTLFVKNKAQLRELRSYKLDSLLLLLEGYITQAEAAGKNSKSDKVTLEFYPAKDRPGKQLPEQIRVTVRNDGATRSAGAKGDKVEVTMGRLFGVKVEEGTGANGSDRVEVHLGSTPKDDSINNARRKAKQEERANRAVRSNFNLNLGLNAWVNQAGSTTTDVQPDLRPFGSRYLSLNWHYDIRVGRRGSPLYLVTGPELAFNNYMLDGNYQFADADNRTEIAQAPAGRELEKSKLAVTTINLPLMAKLSFQNKKGKDAFRIGAGGFVGYRLGSHTKLKYEQDGRTRKDKDRGGYNLQDFQYGVQGIIGIRGIELFAKYNLNEVFKDNRGPQAQTLSFGFSSLLN
ncbi:PorT family protein [Hymenobacter weizhouensis]|uniref:PorT family protein n=1 Tax=Hymenobacter sp. YIM 151500-1 TaxID=2987689 RepID=UPI002226EFCA|nr:PorT family protein [Hymenobacter sp. YIM 151500-1]UYZ64039.1 PorT family protein [Hymenobacter sp. YIM 151500-1]